MFVNKLVLFLITVYKKVISPLLGERCRFYPSCSSYAFECFQKFHFCKAMWYSVIRVFKCHPFHVGGFDSVPED